MQGYWTDLVKAIETGLDASRNLNNRRDEGAHLGNLGLAYSDLGEVEKAISYYEEALAIAREIGHRQGEGADLGNLGKPTATWGRWRRPSATTRRPWPSTEKSDIAREKVRIWATWA